MLPVLYAIRPGMFQRLGLDVQLLSTADFGRRNPDLARRFAEGAREATRYTNAHYLNATSVDAGDIQRAIDVAARYRYIERAFPAAELLSPA